MVEEGERTVVGDEVLGEEGVGTFEFLGEVAPQAAAGNFRAGAGVAFDRTRGILLRRLADRGFDAEPVARGGDLAEGDAALHHAEGAGVHAQKNDALFARAVAAQILLVRRPGVVERVVDVADGRGEGERVDLGREAAGGVNQVLGGI